MSVIHFLILLPLSCSKVELKPADGYPIELQKIVGNSCVSCHAGGLAEGGLGFVDDPELLIANSYIIPGDALNSLLYQKLDSSPPFGSRMPFSGPYLSDYEILGFSKWINSLEKNFTVKATGNNMTIQPSESQKVTLGSMVVFMLSAEPGFDLAESVGGDCPSGAWRENLYTTGAILSDCTLSFSATGNYLVSATAGDNMSIDTSSPQLVKEGSRHLVNVMPSSGFLISSKVGGNCPEGTWQGNVYTTGKIISNCNLAFTTVGQETVTPSGNLVMVNPSTAQIVNQGSTISFTVTPIAVKSALAAGAEASPSYTVSTSIGGTCTPGSWSGATYTTGSITSACVLSFSAENPCLTKVANISFSGEIAPILQNNPINNANKSCMDCHSSGLSKAVFGSSGNATYNTIISAGIISNASIGGKVIVPGDPLNSWLYRKITSSWLGIAASSRMPKSASDYLNADEQSKICNWIYQGALNN